MRRSVGTASRILALLAAALAWSPAEASCNCNVQEFTASTTWSFTGNSLPTGLVASNKLIGSSSASTRPRQFNPNNVQVSGGFLELTVPGGQTGTIECGEVTTNFSVQYASVTTYAIVAEPAGVVNGMFFYRSDQQETDIEWVSNPHAVTNLLSAAEGGSGMLHYTNQAVNASVGASTFAARWPSDATSAVHAYRLDWTEAATLYYLDGVLQGAIYSNVPSQPGPWMWNNWSNGNPYFSTGPPNSTAVFKIQKIIMYYNPA